MRQRNMNRLATFLALAALAAFVLPAFVRADDKEKDAKGNVTGTWKWSFTTQNGDTREQSAKLKQDGEKVTGTVTGGRRGGGDGQGNEIEIKDGKIDKDGKLTFAVEREFNGNKFTQKYEGKVEGDTIKGKVVSTRGDGTTRDREWEAKRSKDDKKEDSK